MIADDAGQAFDDGQVLGLHAHGGEFIRLKFSFPGLGLLGGAPAQLAHRGLGVGDAREYLHFAVGGVHAGQIALVDVNHVRPPQGRALQGGHRLHRRPGYHRDHGVADQHA